MEGRYDQPADHRHTGGTRAQPVCCLLVGLREHDRKFITHAGDDPDDARDRGEQREEPEGLRAVEAGEERRGRDGTGLGEGAVTVMNLRTSVAKEGD